MSYEEVRSMTQYETSESLLSYQLLPEQESLERQNVFSDCLVLCYTPETSFTTLKIRVPCSPCGSSSALNIDLVPSQRNKHFASITIARNGLCL